MPIDSDPLTLMVTGLFLLVAIILGVFFLLRFRWWLTRRGFRPSYTALGNAFQQIQAIAAPKIEHSLKEKRKEKTDEDDEAGPDDPREYYRRKMRRVDETRSRPKAEE